MELILENTQDLRESITDRLDTARLGRDIRICDVVDSTNNYAKQLAREGTGHGTLVWAFTQTAGKGRLGRRWASGNNGGIYMSCILRPDVDREKISMLTPAAGLAVASALRKLTGLNAMIKWPNDVVVNNRKVCGILAEAGNVADGSVYVVLGIGINVNTGGFEEELADMATSVKLETGREWDMTEIIAQVCNNLEKYYDDFCENQNLEGILKEYNDILVNVDRQVRLIDSTGETVAVAKGMDKEGRLLICREGGNVEAVVSGEVSVRGIYGYV